MASPFDLNELKEIDRFEVFPVLKGNIVSVAGEWNGFDELWLYEQCEAAYLKKNNILFRLKTKISHKSLGSITKEHWKAIEIRM